MKVLLVLAALLLWTPSVAAASHITPTPTPSASLDKPGRSPGKSSPSTTRPRFTYSPPNTRAERAARKAKIEKYMDDVALKLADPGVWMDPGVDELTETQLAKLSTAVRNAPVPMRIAIIPAANLSTSSGFSRTATLAWEGEEIPDQLYDRVGVEGIYVVLVDASSQRGGRGLHAVQRADKGPTYHVESAVDQAVDCCAPNYNKMLTRFIERARVVNKPFYVDAAPYAGGAAGLGALWWGGTAFAAGRRRRREQKEHLEIVRPVLTEEIIEFSKQVSTLPATLDPQQTKLIRDVLDTIEKARQRLDKAKGDSDVEAVTTLLGSARYALVCLDAMRSGRPIPEPTPPCFFDPRHGPSTGKVAWAPENGVERTVDRCDDCARQLAANEQPAVRTVTLRGTARPYWTLGEELASYIDGYWTNGEDRWTFPDPDARRAAAAMRSRWASDRPSARLSRWSDDVGTSMSNWGSSSSSWSDDDDDSSSGSSRRRSYSSRTRSSGGGSSRRSGGSRGF
ncbi:hypothetical protein [Kribbella deserti]|uniref:TPM domain-containing protein n=1 Tax=Kribbella deserti TaxID=1926257 RepID=A0ABV6QW91_9ACTN